MKGKRVRHDAIIKGNDPYHLPGFCPFPPLLCFSSFHHHHLSPFQVFPRWFCWTRRVTWSRDRAGWRCWTTQSAGSFPGTLGPCSSSASQMPCSSTKGPASSCLWVRGWGFIIRRSSTWGSVWMKWHLFRAYWMSDSAENSSNVERSQREMLHVVFTVSIYLYANAGMLMQKRKDFFPVNGTEWFRR